MDSVVKNAADEVQIKEASKKERRGVERDSEDLKLVLSSKQGRRFLWRLLGHCKVNQSVWHPSAAIHYNSGQQDVGHFVLAEIIKADEMAYFQMMKEGKEDKNG